jgi:Kinesin motor domain
MASADEKIQVAVRVRPISQADVGVPMCIARSGSNSLSLLSEDGLTMNKNDTAAASSYTFDHLFWNSSAAPTQSEGFAEQKTIFDTLGTSVIRSAWKGINGTIFAYGQTSSGKTHTMM